MKDIILKIVQIHKKLNFSHKNSKNSLFFIFIAGFAAVGVLTLIFTNAAPSSNGKNFEGESYSSQNNTTSVSDATASNNIYLQFDAVSGGDGTSFCSTFPSAPSAKPDATNTGVPAGTVLTPGGSLNITDNGTVIDAKDVSDIYVDANNVTIKNSKVHSSGGSATMGIRIADGKTGTKILNSEIYTTNGGYEGILGGDLIACGNYIHGWENGMTVGGNSMIQANYFDKLAGGQAGPHFDGIEVYFGSNIKVWGNNIQMTDVNGNWLDDTGAINLTAWAGGIDNVEMNGNWIGGGSYTLYVDEQGGYNATNVKITGNKWYRNSYQWGTHLVRDNNSVSVWSGNVFEDNSQIISK